VIVREEKRKMTYILRCQTDSKLKSLPGVAVIECKEAPKQQNKAKKKTECDGKFMLHLADTVLFPQGGGQPWDYGCLEITSGARTGEKIDVKRVERLQDGTTWHFTEVALQEDTIVTVWLDWERRFDHMCQHSGQHLITAVALNTLKYPTVSWSLTKYGDPCYLDLHGPMLTQDQIDDLEDAVNAEILKNVSMTHSVYTVDEFKALDNVRMKEMPSGNFPIRVVSIDGLDENPCCGTHVGSTGELQIIKLLRVEKFGDANRLYFVAGQRARLLFSELYKLSRSLTELTSTGPDRVAAYVSSLIAEKKSNLRTLKALNKEYPELLGPKLIEGGKKVVTYHRKDGTPDFMDALVKSIHAVDGEVTVFTSIGEGSGSFILCGPEKAMTGLGQAIVELLGAKGGGRGARFQGKIPAGNLTTKSIAAAQAKVEEIVQRNME